MAQSPQKLNAAQPIVLEDGTMAQHFREFMQIMADQIPIVDSGDPNGTVEAPQYSRYIDETTPASPVLYIKMVASVGGDRTQGWYAV